MPAVKSNVTATAIQPSPMTSFRLYLQTELARRCANNSHYSLRSFALQVDVDHSTLSQLLRGKRPMTQKTIAEIGARLGLDQAAIERFVAHEKLSARPAGSPPGGVRQLSQDLTFVISDLCHYAILEMVTLKGFHPDTRWIARVLGITTDEVNVAVTRLLRLGLLEMTARERWTCKTEDTTASFDDFAQTAIQRFFEQVRNLSIAALREVPSDSRDQTSATLAVDTKRLPQAIELIQTFRRQMADLLSASDDRDDVYQLEINLFPITNLKRNKEH